MKIILLPAAFAVSSTFMASAYAATATTTLDVVALVGLTCNVTSTPVDFGVVDPLVESQTTGAVSVTCPSGVPYNIALDAGQSSGAISPLRAVSNGGAFIEYLLFDALGGIEWGDGDFAATYPYGPSVAGIGAGTAYTHTIEAILLQAPSAVTDGVYTDVVNVTVYY